MRENADQKKTPYLDTFHVVFIHPCQLAYSEINDFELGYANLLKSFHCHASDNIALQLLKINVVRSVGRLDDHRDKTR